VGLRSAGQEPMWTSSTDNGRGEGRLWRASWSAGSTTLLFRGRVLDISAAGCYVETEARLRLAPGTPVELVFRVNDRVFRCDATSRMIRTKGAGFLFEYLDKRTRAELDSLIAELREDDS
jgi:PilZ domain